MRGERRLPEKMAPHTTAAHCIATVQACEIKVQLIEAFTVCRVVVSALSAVAAGLVGEHDMIAAS